jgi:hypothetical protein
VTEGEKKGKMGRMEEGKEARGWEIPFPVLIFHSPSIFSQTTPAPTDQDSDSSLKTPYPK